MSSSCDFDWIDSAEDVVVPEQAAIAVYLNPKGDVVIRQAGQYHPDEDNWIVVAPDHAPRVAEAILEAAGLAVYHPEDDQAAEPKDRTAAERQRRYRERHRNGAGRDVTFGDGTIPLPLENDGGDGPASDRQK
jgi:hypothetical protein